MQNESFYIAPVSLLGSPDFGLSSNNNQLLCKSVMHGMGVELRWIACKPRESISDHHMLDYVKNLYSKSARSCKHKPQGISKLGED